MRQVMNTQKAILSVNDVGVRFVRTDGTPAEALRRVSFKVFRGEFVCILGRSGHGKTTLLNVVAGLLSVHRGEVRVMARAARGPGADRGVIFQQDAVFPWMRVEENVAFGLRVRSVSKRERLRIAREHLALVGLSSGARRSRR